MRKKLYIAGTLISVLGFCATIILLSHLRQDSAKSAIASVERLVMVPKNEEPVVLTITDRSKVKSAFLQSSETGDKILVFQKNQRAIVYRPATNKIVDIVGVDIGDASKENPRAAWPSEIK